MKKLNRKSDGWGVWDGWNNRPRNSFAEKPVKKIKSAKKGKK